MTATEETLTLLVNILVLLVRERAAAQDLALAQKLDRVIDRVLTQLEAALE